MPTCSFCKQHYEFPKGITIFLNDGKVQFFCSSKCKRNKDLKRDKRKTNWVKKAKKSRKEIRQEKLAELKEQKRANKNQEIRKQKQEKEKK